MILAGRLCLISVVYKNTSFHVFSPTPLRTMRNCSQRTRTNPFHVLPSLFCQKWTWQQVVPRRLSVMFPDPLSSFLCVQPPSITWLGSMSVLRWGQCNRTKASSQLAGAAPPRSRITTAALLWSNHPDHSMSFSGPFASHAEFGQG